MQIKQFGLGLLLGLVVGILGTVGLWRAVASPGEVYITGALRISTESHPDPYLNGRLYVAEPVVLGGPIYLDHHPAIAVNELLTLRDRPVTVRGEIGGMTLSTGEPILTIKATAVAVASPL